MALEKHWLAVTATPLTADGTVFGVVTVADTAGFKVKGLAFLAANTLPPLQVQIQRVVSPTQMIIGPVGTTPTTNNYTDISAYTVALSSTIGFPEQSKNRIKPDDITQAVYEADPETAIRVIGVDQYGRFYTSTNPLPVSPIQNTTTSTPFVENISAPLANTEYSFTFPLNVVKFTMKIRGGYSKVQFAYAAGQTSTKFITLSMGCVYSEDVNVSGKTIYFQTNKPSQIMELLYWTSP